MSKTRSIHHIVFATKRREMTITEEYKKELYSYIMGIIKNKGCRLLRINGIPNHLHLLVDIHPTIAVADLLREIKQWSSRWLKENPHFPLFDCWGEGYYAVSVSVDGLEDVKRYIINQEQHHLNNHILSEMEVMAKNNGLDWYEGDWG